VYHEATAAEVQNGVTFGPNSSYTGTYDPAGTPPTAPTLTFSDHEDGTGGVWTISGSDGGTTNYLYVQEDGGSWALQDTISGDGTSDDSLTTGYYWGFVSTRSGTGTNVSDVEKVQVTDLTSTGTGRFPHLIDIQTKTDTRDNLGARSTSWTDAQTDVPAFVQDIASNDPIRQDQRMIQVTKKAFTATDPSATEGDRVVYGGVNYVIRGEVDQAGLGKLWRINLEKLT
jgi:SPP1 family predicted phage head-tail adaptor